MRVKHKPGGAEPPINHPRYEKAMNVQYTSDIQRICQYLANSDPDVRHTALTFIPQALEETLLKNSLGSHDAPEQGARPLFSKLWKAFFFVIWHEDGTQEQDTVVHMVGALPLYVPSLLSAAALRRLWFQEAYERFARDWSRIDKWRQDKFLYGARRLLYVSLRVLPRSCMGEILNKVLLSQLPGEMFSLAVHLVDILLDELCRAPTLPPATILWYLTDVVARVMAQSPEPAMHLRIREWILEPLCAEKLLTEVPENTVLSPKMRKKFKFDKDMNEVSHLLPGLVRDDKENKKNGAALGGGGDTKEALRLVPHRLCDVLDNLILDPETLDRNRRWLQADVKMMRDYLPILNEGSSVGTKKKNKRELKRSTPDRNSVSGESDSPADAKRRRPAVLDMTVRESSKESSSIIVPSPPLLGKLRAVKAPDMYLRPRLKKSSMKQRSTGSPIS